MFHFFPEGAQNRRGTQPTGEDLEELVGVRREKRAQVGDGVTVLLAHQQDAPEVLANGPGPLYRRMHAYYV